MVSGSLARLASEAVGAGGWSFAQIAQRLSPAVFKFQEVVADRASGSYVWTTDGRKHLDFASGIGVLSTGHCHPHVVSAIQQQAGEIIMAQQNILPASKAMVALLQRLERIMPSSLTSHFFCNSGAEAVENAMKIARNYTGRQNIIAFDGAYHGRTYGAMALTTSKTVYRQNFGPYPSGVNVAPYPYCLHCKTRQAAGGLGYEVAPNVPPLGKPYAERQCCGGPQEALDWMLKMHTAPSETAAIIIEPILGEGGFLTPPPGFLTKLRELCDKHGMLLIFDEVQCGVARTGRWWGHQHLTEAQPDLLLFAKGIASGVPFAGISARPEVYSKMSHGMMGGTYGGSAIGCAAAAATIDVIEGEGLLQNAAERGQQLTRGLLSLAERYPIIDVRGRGLMLAAEFGQKQPDGSLRAEPGTASKLTHAAGRRGLLLLGAGARETVRFLPPLTVSSGQVEEGLAVLEDCLQEVLG
ncbi:hypothetical protein ABPG75_010689 [Micractinium tetrahymenae]